MAKPARRRTAADLITHLRELGLRRYPGAHEKSPWPGHRDLAVNDKTFAYLSAPGDEASMSLKLPKSNGLALSLPGSQPTPYGLGKSGWVSLTFPSDAELPPVAMLESWLEESYRAQAPKKLLAQLDGGSAPAAPAKKKAKRPRAR